MRMTKYPILVAMLSLAACSDYITDIPVVSGEVCSIPLSLSIAAPTDGTPGEKAPVTRGVIDSGSESDPLDGTSTPIKNLWILQYDGTDDNARIVGISTDSYIADYDSGDADKSTAKLIASSGTNTIVFLANTFDPSLNFSSDSNLGDLKKRLKRINSQDDIFGTDPATGDRHIMFSGMTTATISTATTQIACQLRRNLARIRFVLKNSTLGSSQPVTVKSVELRGVPAFSHYLTNYDDRPALFPESSMFSTLGELEGYGMTQWTDGAETENENERLFSFYAPANMRGNTDCTNPAIKGSYNPEGLATYVFIDATYKVDDTDVPISYTFFLGSDLTSNFDLAPNYSYTYNVDLKSRGNALVDARIDDMGPRDFSQPGVERANSYIVNPPSIDGYKREFRFPVDRVNEFWGNQGYENNTNYVISAGRAWTAFLIWDDFDFFGSGCEFIKTTGTGPADYFAIKVPRGVSGNAVVGVKVNDSEYILWSWHLWITDYNPDAAHQAAVAGRYRYPVAGGSLVRMEGTMWTTGVLKDGFMMDRNLGALNDGYPSGGNGRGALFFQFGRKDPFWGNYSVNKYDIVNFNNSKTATESTLSTKAASTNQNVVYSIHHPTEYLTGSYWTTGDKYNPSTYKSDIIWQDPQTAIGGAKYGKKSIFDPSPAGWRLPNNGVMSDMRSNNNGTPTTNISATNPISRNFSAFTSNGKTGLRYWPYMLNSDGNYSVTDEIFFPAAGYRNNSNGGLNYAGSYGFYWYGSPRSATSGYCLNFNSTYLNTSNNYGRAYGFSVRCVSEW